MSMLPWVLATLLVTVDLGGILLPAIPGTILTRAGRLLAAWADGFQHNVDVRPAAHISDGVDARAVTVAHPKQRPHPIEQRVTGALEPGTGNQ